MKRTTSRLSGLVILVAVSGCGGEGPDAASEAVPFASVQAAVQASCSTALGNCEALAPGHAFSIEPGIYLPGQWGARLEDIVVAAESGPDALNTVDHALITVDV